MGRLLWRLVCSGHGRDDYLSSRKRKKARRRPSVDPRVVSSRVVDPVVSPEGNEYTPGDIVTLIQRARLEDGREVMFQAPSVVALNLIEAQKKLDRALRDRDRYLKSLKEDVRYGAWMSKRDDLLLDVFARLTEAVLLSFVAIEGMANAAVSELPKDATVWVERTGQKVRIQKDEMERRLSTAEKLDLVLPIATGLSTIKGTVAWEAFVRMRMIRDDLVHMTARGYSNEPDDPSPYARLLRGEGDRCVEDARLVISKAWPAWVPS